MLLKLDPSLKHYPMIVHISLKFLKECNDASVSSSQLIASVQTLTKLLVKMAGGKTLNCSTLMAAIDSIKKLPGSDRLFSTGSEGRPEEGAEAKKVEFENIDRDSLSYIVGKFVKGYVDYPSEVVIEDTTEMRDRLPEVQEAPAREVEQSPKQNQEAESNTQKTELSNSEVDKEVASSPKPQQKADVKTSADVRKALDNFFDE
jgi:hypothetical protein